MHSGACLLETLFLGGLLQTSAATEKLLQWMRHLRNHLNGTTNKSKRFSKRLGYDICKRFDDSKLAQKIGIDMGVILTASFGSLK